MFSVELKTLKYPKHRDRRPSPTRRGRILLANKSKDLLITIRRGPKPCSFRQPCATLEIGSGDGTRLPSIFADGRTMDLMGYGHPPKAI